MAYIIVVGTTDLHAIGPFKSHAEADRYGSEFEDEDRFHKEPWRVVELGLPIVIDRDEDEEDEPYDQEHDDAYWDHLEYDEDEVRNRMFTDPSGDSALRAASKENPRDQPCPTCHRPNLLTPADVRLGYQCDRCSDRAERGVDY